MHSFIQGAEIRYQEPNPYISDDFWNPGQKKDIGAMLSGAGKMEGKKARFSTHLFGIDYSGEAGANANVDQLIEAYKAWGDEHGFKIYYKAYYFALLTDPIFLIGGTISVIGICIGRRYWKKKENPRPSLL